MSGSPLLPSMCLGYWSWKGQILRCQLPSARRHWWWVIRANLQACEFSHENDTAHFIYWHSRVQKSLWTHHIQANIFTLWWLNAILKSVILRSWHILGWTLLYFYSNSGNKLQFASVLLNMWICFGLALNILQLRSLISGVKILEETNRIMCTDRSKCLHSKSD